MRTGLAWVLACALAATAAAAQAPADPSVFADEAARTAEAGAAYAGETQDAAAQANAALDQALAGFLAGVATGQVPVPIDFGIMLRDLLAEHGVFTIAWAADRYASAWGTASGFAVASLEGTEAPPAPTPGPAPVPPVPSVAASSSTSAPPPEPSGDTGSGLAAVSETESSTTAPEADTPAPDEAGSDADEGSPSPPELAAGEVAPPPAGPGPASDPAPHLPDEAPGTGSEPDRDDDAVSVASALDLPPLPHPKRSGNLIPWPLTATLAGLALAASVLRARLR